MNREQALLCGSARYAGTPCARHAEAGGQRYTKNWGCVRCALEATLRCGERKRAAAPRLQAPPLSEDERKAKERARSLLNNRTPKRRAYMAAYRTKPEVIAAKRFYKAVRESHVSKRATPAWADKQAIAAIYAEARRKTQDLGELHVVDHFYPLKGRTVCGLHVEHNLRVITSDENLRKNNRMQEEG